MPTLPNTGVITPTPGGDAGTWDDKNNAAWSNYDDHRHESGNGLRIRTAGIDINADLTFGGLYAPIALHRLTFASIVALTGNNKSLFVNTSDNELYWRSNTGTNVKLTAGNALNVAAFTGGFGAGYTSASAAADYDDSTEQYTFKQAAAGAWSRAGFGGIRLYEFGTSETLRVGLLAPAGLAASYDITMPLAAPASTVPLRMDSSGVITATESHGDKTATFHGLSITAYGAYVYGTHWAYTISPRAVVKSLAAVDLVLPLSGFLVGDKIKSVTFALYGDGAADLTFADVIKCDSSSGGAPTSIGTSPAITNQPASFSDYTVDVTDTTWTSTLAIHIRFACAAANLEIGNVRVTYDRP